MLLAGLQGKPAKKSKMKMQKDLPPAIEPSSRKQVRKPSGLLIKCSATACGARWYPYDIAYMPATLEQLRTWRLFDATGHCYHHGGTQLLRCTT